MFPRVLKQLLGVIVERQKAAKQQKLWVQELIMKISLINMPCTLLPRTVQGSHQCSRPSPGSQRCRPPSRTPWNCWRCRRSGSSQSLKGRRWGQGALCPSERKRSSGHRPERGQRIEIKSNRGHAILVLLRSQTK